MIRFADLHVGPYMLKIDRASSYRESLEALVRAHTDHATKLLFVEDIAAWGQQTGARVSGNPSAAALVGTSAQPWLIAVREIFTSEQVQSVIDAMELFENHADRVRQLAAPERFLQHTVLHELAHLVLSCGNEQEELCNRWAFERLPALS